MRWVLTGAAGIGLAVWLAIGCNGGIDLPNGDDIPDAGDILDRIPSLPDLGPQDLPAGLASVIVRVTEAGPNAGTAGGAVVEATGVLAGVTQQSDGRGFIAFEEAQAGDNVLLTVTADGYMDNARTIDVVPGGEVEVDVVMAPYGATGTGTDAAVEHNGGGITIPEGGLLTPTGAPVDTVHVTVVRPSASDYGSIFPGAFEGLRTGETTPTPIRSYGIVDVDLRDGSGERVGLADGSEVTVRVPIDPAVDDGLPTIPLWYFDPEDGAWHEEGELTRYEADDEYRGTVTHFTTWNCDQPYDPAYTHVKLVDQDDRPIRAGRIVLVGNGVDQTAYTEDNGEIDGPVPPNERVKVTAEKGGVVSETETVDTPSVGGTVSTTITLPLAYIQATVITEQGQPVSGARVAVVGDGWDTAFSTNRIGEAVGAVRPQENVRVWAEKYSLRSGETTVATPGLGETQHVIIRLGESLYVPTVPIAFPASLTGDWLLTGIGLSEEGLVTAGVNLLALHLAIAENNGIGAASVSTGLLQKTYSGPLVITQKTQTDDGTVYDIKPYSSGEQTNYVSLRLSPDGQALWELVRDADTGATMIAARFARVG